MEEFIHRESWEWGKLEVGPSKKYIKFTFAQCCCSFSRENPLQLFANLCLISTEMIVSDNS